MRTLLLPQPGAICSRDTTYIAYRPVGSRGLLAVTGAGQRKTTNDKRYVATERQNFESSGGRRQLLLAGTRSTLELIDESEQLLPTHPDVVDFF